ncbi:winged helix-turn-helix domain-containing protein [Teredinibacter turnerae]|uniref:winged helix-turn-helix domain-containing protein n=1 Tax=Teredinibacter turnerae TaxID=2426 RepID=UPI0003A6119B|nr:winged helix-turn-helix domain-containing protein [Teredinibacter turnerae]
MIEAIVGSTSAERVLMFITARESGYAAEIAKTFSTDISPIQKQLDRLERDGLLINEKIGRTRLYKYNPRYPFVPELKALIDKAIAMAPEAIQDTLLYDRRRPRKKDKPL